MPLDASKFLVRTEVPTRHVPAITVRLVRSLQRGRWGCKAEHFVEKYVLIC